MSAFVLLAALLAIVSAQVPTPQPTMPYCPDMVTVPRNVTGDCEMMCQYRCDSQECTLTTTSTHSSIACDAPTSIDPFCPAALSDPGPSRTLPCNNTEICTYNCANSTHTGTCDLSYSHNNLRWNVNCSHILPNPTNGTTAMPPSTTTTNVTNTTTTATPTFTVTTTATVTTTTTAPPTTVAVPDQVPICPQSLSTPGPSNMAPCKSTQTCSYSCSSSTAFAHCLLSYTTNDMSWHVQCGSPILFTSVGTGTTTQEPTKSQICPAGLTIAGNYTACVASVPCIYSCANSTTTAQCTMSYTADTQEWTVFCNTMMITTTTAPTTATTTAAPNVQPRSPFCPAPILTPSATTLCSPTAPCSFLCYNATHYANCSMTYQQQWNVACGDIQSVPAGWNSTTSTTAGITAAPTTTTTTVWTIAPSSTTSTGATTASGQTTASASGTASDTTSGDGSATTTTAGSATGDDIGSASDGTGDSSIETTTDSGIEMATDTDGTTDETTMAVDGASGLVASVMIVVIVSLATWMI